MKAYSFLALGDSYTIGEGVLLHQNFAYQAVQALRAEGLSVSAPEILARTGWTTNELLAAADSYSFLPSYDVVTLLIGVNNQYRGSSAIAYKEELEKLLVRAIDLAGGKKGSVLLLSIPDYGVTPFAAHKDPTTIAHEIDIFNGIKRALATQYKIDYIDITDTSRLAQPAAEWLATDGLHPSATQYKAWVALLLPYLRDRLK